MQSCIQFAGDKEGLRGWAKKTGLKDCRPMCRISFLYGLPGVVFDASNEEAIRAGVRGRRFVLRRRRDGQRSGRITNLEQDLNDARITFKVTAEKTDPRRRR